MNKTYYPLFKIDTKGKVRIWYMEQQGSRYRTIAGIKDGNLVTSEWTQAKVTNEGRSNERDPIAQATFEIEATYENKLTREYHKSLETISEGAHFFKPMLAQKYEEFEPGYAQPKLDGIRCIANKNGLWSRQGKPITGAPHIFEDLKPLFAANPDLIFDGELYNHDYKDDFNTIVSAVKKQKPDAEDLKRSKGLVQYHIYDLPMEANFWSRINELYSLLPFSNSLIPVETRIVNDSEEYDALHGKWLADGYEGSIWRSNGEYEQKRSKNLRKRKEFQDDEFPVVRIEEGLGNWSGVAKSVVCRLPDGREFGAGIKGSRERAVKLLYENHKVVTVKYFNLTPDGIPRFPVAIKFHGSERTL